MEPKQTLPPHSTQYDRSTAPLLPRRGIRRLIVAATGVMLLTACNPVPADLESEQAQIVTNVEREDLSDSAQLQPTPVPTTEPIPLPTPTVPPQPLDIPEPEQHPDEKYGPLGERQLPAYSLGGVVVKGCYGEDVGVIHPWILDDNQIRADYTIEDAMLEIIEDDSIATGLDVARHYAREAGYLQRLAEQGVKVTFEGLEDYDWTDSISAHGEGDDPTHPDTDQVYWLLEAVEASLERLDSYPDGLLRAFGIDSFTFYAMQNTKRAETAAYFYPGSHHIELIVSDLHKHSAGSSFRHLVTHEAIGHGLHSAMCNDFEDLGIEFAGDIPFVEKNAAASITPADREQFWSNFNDSAFVYGPDMIFVRQPSVHGVSEVEYFAELLTWTLEERGIVSADDPEAGSLVDINQKILLEGIRDELPMLYETLVSTTPQIREEYNQRIHDDVQKGRYTILNDPDYDLDVQRAAFRDEEARRWEAQQAAEADAAQRSSD